MGIALQLDENRACRLVFDDSINVDLEAPDERSGQHLSKALFGCLLLHDGRSRSIGPLNASRDKFNSAANIKYGARTAYIHDQGSLTQSNPILKSVISEFTNFKMNSTQKEWNAITKNVDSICSKAIEFVENHQRLDQIRNPVAREFANSNASPISLLMALSDAHLQYNIFDK